MKKILFAFSFSIVILLTSYLVGNTSFPQPNEMAVLQKFNKVRSICGLTTDTVPSNLLFVNIGYDKKMVDVFDKYQMPLGKLPYIDKQKLLRFLHACQKSNNYKYIFLDIVFSKKMEEEYDTELFNTLASMKRIVLPMNPEESSCDKRLARKMAHAKYTVLWNNTSLSHYKFMDDGIASVPLRMYQDMDHKTITQYGPLFFSSGHICRNGISLPLDIQLNLDDEDAYAEGKYVNMGIDLLEEEDVVSISDRIKGKIVVVGDFESDVHRTYAGILPGSVICMNAYYALKKNYHLVSGTFTFFLFILYAVISLLSVKRITVSRYVTNPWYRILLSFFGISALLAFISTVTYIVFNIIYSVYIPVLLFTLLATFLNIKDTLKTARK